MKDQEIIGGIKRVDNDYGQGYELFCPGCKSLHYVAVETPLRSNGARWSFDGNTASPTFSPSLVITIEAYKDEDFDIPRSVCHSFIRAGRWEFLSDCTHDLASQTVPIPPHPQTAAA